MKFNRQSLIQASSTKCILNLLMGFWIKKHVLEWASEQQTDEKHDFQVFNPFYVGLSPAINAYKVETHL